MPKEYDELNRRRRERSAHSQQRKKARIRHARLRLAGLLAILVVVGVVIGVVIARNRQESPGVSTAPPVSSSGTVPTVPVPTEPETTIKLVFGGDVVANDLVVASGENSGRYDYSGVFMDVTPVLADADATLLNFEGNLFDAPYGTDRSSAPQELAQALASSGVDFIQMANSCTVNNGLSGLFETLNRLRSAGLEPLGAFASPEEFQQTQGFTIRNIGGIRVAFVAFTKGVGSLGLPAGSEYCVNLLYKDYATTYQEVDTKEITRILKAVEAQKPDITIAMLHWGSEYNDFISETQEEIVKLMHEHGVDAIIGTHPHYVQPVEYDEENGTVVAYSLGDFYGDAQKAGTNYSILLELEITRDNTNGETKITACDYVPIYTLTPEFDGEERRIVRIEEALLRYENDHVNRVSDKAYENMKHALERIQDRVQPQEKDEEGGK